MIALYTGFHFSEVLNLQWKDTDFTKEIVSINPKHNFTPKNYEFRTIPLNKELKEYLLSIIYKNQKRAEYNRAIKG